MVIHSLVHGFLLAVRAWSITTAFPTLTVQAAITLKLREAIATPIVGGDWDNKELILGVHGIATPPTQCVSHLVHRILAAHSTHVFVATIANLVKPHRRFENQTNVATIVAVVAECENFRTNACRFVPRSTPR